MRLLDANVKNTWKWQPYISVYIRRSVGNSNIITKTPCVFVLIRAVLYGRRLHNGNRWRMAAPVPQAKRADRLDYVHNVIPCRALNGHSGKLQTSIYIYICMNWHLSSIYIYIWIYIGNLFRISQHFSNALAMYVDRTAFEYDIYSLIIVTVVNFIE